MRHVALLIETSRTFGREILDGVQRYASEHAGWSIFAEQRALESKPPPWLRHWHGDGILTRSNSQAVVDVIRRLGVPAVELRSATRIRHSFPAVLNNSRAIGRLVAEHLMERGLRNFGVYTSDTEEGFRQRCEQFQETLLGAGYPIHAYHSRERSEKPNDWERQQKKLAKWLKSLPKPCGIMVCIDQLGFWLLDACGRVGLEVPDEVAVVGVGNDETVCTLSRPALSSVQLNGVKIGYEAASLLDGFMAGRAPPSAPILVDPIRVVGRLSSDVVAVEDPDIARALRFIREHACEGITVDDVLSEVAISRSTLERRVSRLLGRSPADEIVRIRLNQVQSLLATSSLNLSAIAYKTGFTNPQYLCTLFKRQFNTTPSAYRKQRQS